MGLANGPQQSQNFTNTNKVGLQDLKQARLTSSPHFSPIASMNLTQRNWQQRNNSTQKSPAMDEDSIFQHDRMPIPQRTQRRLTQKKAGMPSVQENDSLFQQTNSHPNYAAMQAMDNTGRGSIMQKSNRKTNSIYSIKDQLHVESLLRKKFKELEKPRASQQFAHDMAIEQQQLQQNATCPMSSSMSCEIYNTQTSRRSSQHMSRAAPISTTVVDPRHIVKQKFLMQQHAMAKLTKSSMCSTDTEFDRYKSNTRSKRKNQTKWQLAEEIYFDVNKVAQSTKHSQLSLTSSRHETQRQRQQMSTTRHFSFVQQNQYKSGVKSSMTNRNACIASQGSPHRALQTQNNFVMSNKKNLLKSAADKLHPTFSVWPRGRDKTPLAQMRQLNLESTDNNFDSVTKVGGASSDDEEVAAEVKRKKGMIKEMQVRLAAQTKYNGHEFLSSVGVQSRRAHLGPDRPPPVPSQTHPNELSQDPLTLLSSEPTLEKLDEVSQIIQTAKEEKIALSGEKVIDPKIMVGKTKFDLPTPNKLQRYYNQVHSGAKLAMIEEMAAGKGQLEGQIALEDYDKKIERVKDSQFDPYQMHAQNFTDKKYDARKPKAKDGILVISEMLMNKLNNNLQKQCSESDVEDERKHADRGMSKSEIKETLDRKIISGHQREGPILNRCLKEETTLVSSMGKKFIERVKYTMQFTQREVEHEGKGVVNHEDPKVQYFLQCRQDLDLALPILDKVCRKTLMLQEYTLSPGHCRGLAQACKFFDHRFVNRVFLNNCGIDDGEFASILEGLNHLKDFKSIIYKANMFGEKSLAALRPLLLKRLPNHLQELTIIDCHMNSSLVCRLIELLLDKDMMPQLRKLGLVNATHSENSFAKIVQFLEESQHLEELDLSWSKLSLMQWRKFMNVLKENRQLVYLNISYNKILEPQTDPTSPEPFSNQSWELSPRNKEVMECLKSFVKYNVHLVTLNLENTGMNQQAIAYVVGLLRRCQGIRCLHLSANEGITPALNEWVRKRISAKDKIEPNMIHPYQKLKKQINKLKTKAGLRLGQALFLAKQNKLLEEIRQEQQWSNIREGMKLKNIQRAKAMNEVSTYMGDIDMEGSFLAKTLVINRELGAKHLMPGSGKWSVHDDKKSECWKCSQHILTIFLWTPSIGTLTCEKDLNMTNYYKEQLEAQRDMDDSLAMNASKTPLFCSSANGWRYQHMQDILPFCMKNDLDPPNFEEECLRDGLVKLNRTGKLTADQHQTIKQYAETYYKTDWQDALLRMLRYKKPQIANAHLLSRENLQYTESEPIYIHIAWMPPGRNTFCISHDESAGGIDAEESKADNFLSNLLNRGLRKMKQTFYVHDMLSTFRDEHIPFYYNPRNIHRVEHDQYRERPVFKDWKQDTPDITSMMLAHDAKHWSLRNICQSDNEYKRLEGVIVQNLQSFTDAYHYLQTKSKAYPFISYAAARKFFYMPAIQEQGFSADIGVFDTVLKQATINFAKARQRIKLNQPDKTLNRAEFIEFMVLLARYLLSSENNEDDYSPFMSVTLIKSVQLFIEQCMKKFLNDLVFSWQEFREDKLWQPEVRLIYSMNEQTLRSLFAEYSGRHSQGKAGSTKDKSAVQGLVLQDCEELILDDAKLVLTKAQVKYAFAICKMTVVDETSQEAKVTYSKIIFVEFLEFLARIAELVFEDSEMVGLMLCEKLEHLFDELFTVIGAKRIKQQRIVEEFSESDEDY